MASINVNIVDEGSVYTKGTTVWYGGGTAGSKERYISGGYDLPTLTGLPTIELRVNGASANAHADSESTWSSDTGVKFALANVSTIDVKGTGAGGLTKAEASYFVSQDLTAPTSIGATITGASEVSGQKWITSGAGATVTISASDQQSGVWKYSCNGTWSENAVFGLAATTEGENTVTYNAMDHVSNKGTEATLKYYVDNTAPVVSVSGYEEGTWTNQDITVTISADDGTGSGVKSIAETTKTFSVAEGGYISDKYDFTATDNVGLVGTKTLSYKIDKAAPTISLSKDSSLPTWVKSVNVTATCNDEGSGVNIASLEYSVDDGETWTLCGGTTFEVNHNCTLLVRVSDNAGNSTQESIVVDNVDPIPPEITITANVETIAVSQIVSAKIIDPEPRSGLCVPQQYSIDGGTSWLKYTSETEITCNVNNTTYIFRAYDNAGNETTKEVTFNNIYANDAEAVEIIDAKEMIDQQDHVTVTIDADSTLTVTEAGTLTVADELFFLGSNSVLNNEGSVLAGSVSVYGTGNEINGNTVAFSKFYMDADASLATDKNQFDVVMASETLENSVIRMQVAEVDGNALREQDVDALMAKKVATVDVAFNQDLISVHSLTFKSGKDATISFRDAYGTTKSDEIVFGKNSSVVFGQAERVIDLEEGRNKIQANKNATAEILSDLTNVSTIKTASGSDVTLANVDFRIGYNATLKAEGASFKAGNISGSDKKNTIKIGKKTEFEAGSVAFADKADKITAGSDSIVEFGSTDGDVFSGMALDFNGGNDTLTANGTRFVAGAVNFDDGNDKLTTGTGTAFAAVASKTGSWEEPTEILYADIDFGDGSDKITTGKNSVLAAGNVISADTISLGAYSTAQVGNVIGTKKLTASSGKEEQVTSLKAAAVTGTEKGDTFSFGNWNDVDFASLDFGDGSDTLKIGSHSTVDIDSLDFGDGKSDKLTISKYATLSVDRLNVDSLDSLTMGKDAYLCIGDADDLADAQAKWSKYADQIISKLA